MRWWLTVGIATTPDSLTTNKKEGFAIGETLLLTTRRYFLIGALVVTVVLTVVVGILGGVIGCTVMSPVVTRAGATVVVVGATVVVVGATVVVVGATVVVVVRGIVVVVTGTRGARGKIATLLRRLFDEPIIATSQQCVSSDGGNTMVASLRPPRY